MTCQQLRSYFDQLERDLPVEALRHVSDCASCRAFVDTRKELLSSLRLLRESAPTVTASLDAAVLARYREVKTVSALSTSSTWKNLAALRRFAALAAAALIIFAGATLVRKTPVPVEPHPQPLSTPEIARSSVPDSPKVDHASTQQDHAGVPKDSVRKPNRAVSGQPIAVASSIRPDDSQGFRSLMYCDELSCDGGMDVVRVELPALPAGFLPAPNTPIRSVSAEVLVGADGFARGIRIVQ